MQKFHTRESLERGRLFGMGQLRNRHHNKFRINHGHYLTDSSGVFEDMRALLYNKEPRTRIPAATNRPTGISNYDTPPSASKTSNFLQDFTVNHLCSLCYPMHGQIVLDNLPSGE